MRGLYCIASGRRQQLARPLVNDRILIEVNGDAPDGVHMRDSQVFLDGDYDLQPGGDFQ